MFHRGVRKKKMLGTDIAWFFSLQPCDLVRKKLNWRAAATPKNRTQSTILKTHYFYTTQHDKVKVSWLKHLYQLPLSNAQRIPENNGPSINRTHEEEHSGMPTQRPPLLQIVSNCRRF